MDGEIVERAVAGARLAAPGERRLRVGHEVLVHLDAKLGQPADRAAPYELCGCNGSAGTLDVVVAEDGDLAARPRRRGHALGVGERRRHRLFAPHVLARFERGDRHRRVQSVRGGDRDDIDGRVGDQRAPVGGRRLEAEFVGALARKALVDLAQHDAPHDRRVAEHRLNAGPGEGMAFAHVARADQSDADGVHEAPPASSLRGYCPTRQNKYFTLYPIWNICSILYRPERLAHVEASRRREGETMSYHATTEPPESFDALKRRLIEIEPHLPKRLRQAAAYALEHPDEFALGTASALARSADVQASTLVRFAQTLGFAGFSDLQEVFRCAPPQPLARLFRAAPGAAAERPRQRRSDPSLVRIRRFGGGLDRAAARRRSAARARPGGRPSGPRANNPLPRPEAVVLRRPLSDLCALPARHSGVPHR